MIARTLRLLSGLFIFATGAVHLQQYLGAGYSSIPTIGPLFLLNAIAAAVVAIGLFAPLEAILDRRASHLTVALLAIAGAAIAIGSLIALFISEGGTLFGFHESGYRSAIVLAIVAEGVSLALTVPLAALSLKRMRSSPRPAGREPQAWGSRSWQSHS
jgi:hypothetical protein